MKSVDHCCDLSCWWAVSLFAWLFPFFYMPSRNCRIASLLCFLLNNQEGKGDGGERVSGLVGKGRECLTRWFTCRAKPTGISREASVPKSVFLFPVFVLFSRVYSGVWGCAGCSFAAFSPRQRGHRDSGRYGAPVNRYVVPLSRVAVDGNRWNQKRSFEWPAVHARVLRWVSSPRVLYGSG